MIRFKNLTKQFENGKGIFDFSFEVEEGEVFGLVGSKCSGKTTALRVLMGFEVPTKGKCTINGKNCLGYGRVLHRIIGYLPDQFALPSVMTGRQFLYSNAQLRGVKNLEYLFEMARRLELDVDQKIGNMASADVQKTGIICALLHNPQIVLMDNPFRNLDMRGRSALLELILEQKEKGKMIILGLDTADTADLACDRVGLLDNGNMVYLGDIENMRDNMYRRFIIQFADARSVIQFSKEEFEVISIKDRSLTVSIRGELLPLIRTLYKYPVTNLEAVPLSLEETFVHLLGGVYHG